MKKTGYKLLALLLCLVLVCGLVTTASGSSGIYFMAVNETLVPMTSENMPIMVGGVLYVPYIMFSLRHNTGVNLGVTAQYSTTRRTVMVSQGQDVVIFDPGDDSSYDLNGNVLDGRAILRNSMPYIPLAWVCEHFGTIRYSVIPTPYGQLVRVTNQVASLSDEDFVKNASDMLKDNYLEYMNSVGGIGSDPSGNDPEQSRRPETGPLVYLAFTGGDFAEECAQVLEGADQRGLFLLTVEELSRERELVRRLVGMGHQVGLRLTEIDPEACLGQVEEGSRLLAEIAHCQLTVLRAETLDGSLRTVLKEQGYALWDPSVRVDGGESMKALSADLDGKLPNYVEFPCEEGFAVLLADALAAFDGSACRLRQATAPVL